MKQKISPEIEQPTEINNILDTMENLVLSNAVVGCPGKEARKRKSLIARKYHKKDASAVAQWVTEDEIEFLGGAPELPFKDQIQNWSDDAYLAFVLEADKEPVAFMVVEPNNEGPPDPELSQSVTKYSRLEFGRILVDPAKRRMGYATSLFIHLYKAYLESFSDRLHIRSALLLRANRLNKTCHEFLKALPIKKIECPEEETYLWFGSSDIYKPEPKELGQFIAQLRGTAGLTQQRLAFLACIDPSTLAMIETGQRPLKLDDAGRLLSILCRKPLDERTFAAHLLGMAPYADRWSFKDTLSGELISEDQTLWVFSDKLAETTIEGAIDKAIRAVSSGFERYYFVPPAYPKDRITIISTAFSKRIKNPEILESNVRFYRAPPSLCALRVAVHNPIPREFDAERISVATGEGQRRLDVAIRTQGLATRFLEEIREGMLAADNNSEHSSAGFQRVSINWRELCEQN